MLSDHLVLFIVLRQSTHLSAYDTHSGRCLSRRTPPHLLPFPINLVPVSLGLCHYWWRAQVWACDSNVIRSESASWWSFEIHEHWTLPGTIDQVLIPKIWGKRTQTQVILAKLIIANFFVHVHELSFPKSRFKRSDLDIGNHRLLWLRGRRFPNDEFGRQISGVIETDITQ